MMQMDMLESLFDLSHLEPPPEVLEGVPYADGDRAPYPAISWFAMRAVAGL